MIDFKYSSNLIKSIPKFSNEISIKYGSKPSNPREQLVVQVGAK
jgi:hypothetical protein